MTVYQHFLRFWDNAFFFKGEMNYSTKSVFTCNRDETRPRIKKLLFTHEFHLGIKQAEFHSGMKLCLRKNL